MMDDCNFYLIDLCFLRELTKSNVIYLNLSNWDIKEAWFTIGDIVSAIGGLRSEKVDFAATIKKQQARISHLETAIEDMSNEVIMTTITFWQQ